MNIDYERVAENDSDSHDYSNKFEENEGHTPFVGNPRSGKWGLLLTLLNIVLFTISATVWGIAFTDHLPTNSQALQKVLYYSPLLDKIEFQFENRKVEGTLFDEETLSKDELLLRSHSNDASDAAWAALSVIERIPMTAEEVRRLGKDPDTVVKIPPSYGFGDRTHAVQLDAQHNLHCLDTVRKYAYREYYFPEAIDTGNGTSPLTELDQAHLSHCLSMLRQALTCNPSLDIITHNWMRTQLYPPPDFAVNRKCIKHSQILEWQARNKIERENWWEIGEQGPGTDDYVLEPPAKLLDWTIRLNS
ncbi:uncharacterized protein ALTATR162_LOCUS10930 [Alternaria atra]|uniref:Tat pathway signal sequence n=1 Tax=Alternaria atra TaxID=119953 RepID=A0A8J2N568_9PLEO|nr:uncharacterized protein ALTATR162_LOCUS10930 [Alternaria atra]CAG5184140.1 unnamed protein product [Alternaria atra]